MLRGRRLPLPQPALPGWSSKPSGALARLPPPPRSFSSTTPRLGLDPRDLLLSARQDLKAEKKARREASEKQAQQRERAQLRELQKLRELQRQRELLQQRDLQKKQELQQQREREQQQEKNKQTRQADAKTDADAGQRAPPITPTKPNEQSESPTKPSRYDEQGAVTKPSGTPSEEEKPTSREEDTNSEPKPADTKFTQASSKTNDSTTVAVSPALSRKTRILNHQTQYANLKSAFLGASFWVDAKVKVKDEDEDPLPAEPNAESGPAGGSENKVQSGPPSSKDFESIGTVIEGNTDLGFFQQFSPRGSFVKIRKYLAPAQSQDQQPPGKEDARPPENAKENLDFGFFKYKIRKHFARARSQDQQPPGEEDVKPPENAKPAPAPAPEPEKPAKAKNPITSIFDLLFRRDKEEKERPTQIEPTLPKPVVTKSVPDFVPNPSRPAGSVFAQLFPKEAESKETQEEEAEQSRDRLSPPEDAVFVSLRNEVRSWIPPTQQHEIVAPKPGEHGSDSTVVTIWGVSPSLVESDFFRIIPESKHVEGWAGGLVKVVQAREPLNQRPLGRYYLMFHSRPSAHAYVERLNHLYALSRKLLYPSGAGFSPAKGRLALAAEDPQPFMSKEEEAEVRSLTILPPSLPLNLKVDSLNTELMRQVAAHGAVADVVQALQTEVDGPAKVLVTVSLPGGGLPEPSRYGLTANDLWLTLRDDGRERSAPWSLVNSAEGIMPVRVQFDSTADTPFEAKPLPVDLKLDESEDVGPPPVADTSPADPFSVLLGNGHTDDDGGKKEDNKKVDKKVAKKKDKNKGVEDPTTERFNRFILTFKHRSHAKRFVRAWHKRTIHDAELDRHVILDAVALI